GCDRFAVGDTCCAFGLNRRRGNRVGEAGGAERVAALVIGDQEGGGEHVARAGGVGGTRGQGGDAGQQPPALVDAGLVAAPRDHRQGRKLHIFIQERGVTPGVLV